MYFHVPAGRVPLFLSQKAYVYFVKSMKLFINKPSNMHSTCLISQSFYTYLQVVLIWIFATASYSRMSTGVFFMAFSPTSSSVNICRVAPAGIWSKEPGAQRKEQGQEQVLCYG